LSSRNGVLRLTIRDNGVGFDTGLATTLTQRGVRNMNERVQALSGRLSVTSVLGRGTKVMVEVPVRGE